MHWDRDRANGWYAGLPWQCGCNFFPSTCANPTEMWQAESYDEGTIDREMALAAGLGFNTVRTNLQYLVWAVDPIGHRLRLERFLAIAERHGISVMLCLFDDCAHSGKQPWTGPQDRPRPGVHNSCWTPSPGHERVVDRSVWTLLELYVKSVVGDFAEDRRILAWDLYNEPGNWPGGERSLPLLEAAFAWARWAEPFQPITSGVWHEGLRGVNAFLLKESDVVTFHHYGPLSETESWVFRMREAGRPVLCTEWMARTRGSRFETHLPWFRKEGMGCYCWGLVNGRTQTQFPWDSPAGAPEPGTWFHDIFRGDLKPYRDDEVALIRRVTGVKGKP